MKIATIGSGAIVDQAYASFAQIPSIEPAAVYSRTMEKARAYADRHHVTKTYDNLEEMLADEEIDTVYIASPNSLHVPQAKKRWKRARTSFSKSRLRPASLRPRNSSILLRKTV
ncbi:Gfo/Idh/MocA family oxidoreductase [Allobaculum sp. Allo2]|nr:Gfo/Idh/MocA family oxidoreductase [Allobaculum sp. Allo2]UNT94017.1 Gfo/Idh/MocA family oxidoreductase [Allobaculum sp. Allo2]